MQKLPWWAQTRYGTGRSVALKNATDRTLYPEGSVANGYQVTEDLERFIALLQKMPHGIVNATVSWVWLDESNEFYLSVMHLVVDLGKGQYSPVYLETDDDGLVRIQFEVDHITDSRKVYRCSWESAHDYILDRIEASQTSTKKVRVIELFHYGAEAAWVFPKNDLPRILPLVNMLTEETTGIPGLTYVVAVYERGKLKYIEAVFNAAAYNHVRRDSVHVRLRFSGRKLLCEALTKKMFGLGIVWLTPEQITLPSTEPVEAILNECGLSLDDVRSDWRILQI